MFEGLGALVGPGRGLSELGVEIWEGFAFCWPMSTIIAASGGARGRTGSEQADRGYNREGAVMVEQHSNQKPALEDVFPQAARRPAPAKAVPVYVPSGSGDSRRPRRSVWGVLFTYLLVLVLVLSVGVNLWLGMVFLMMRPEVYRAGEGPDKIALVPIEGTIDMAMAEQVREMLQKAGKDESVKGVVLVVNSPGGAVAPSNMINNYVKQFRKRHPESKVYVSIEQVGASGAYWIAAAAEKIYAQENSMVGSIGVIHLNFVVKDALEQKLGIVPIVIKSSRSPHKDESSPFRMPTEEEKAEIQGDLDTIHERFVKVVSVGRSLAAESVWPLATGEVWFGAEAQEQKLVDAVGFLDDVIDDLVAELELEDPSVIRYVSGRSVLGVLMGGSSRSEALEVLDVQKQFERWATAPRTQALWLGQ